MLLIYWLVMIFGFYFLHIPALSIFAYIFYDTILFYS